MRLRASDHKHPATPKARTVNEYVKKVEQEDRRNKKAARALLRKVSHNTSTKFKEGHGRSPNAYQIPSQKEHFWHQYFIYTKFEEGHGTRRVLNGKRDGSSRLEGSEVDGPGKGTTKPNMYQIPNHKKHSWHKNFKNKTSSKYIYERGIQDGDDTRLERSLARDRHNSQHCDRRAITKRIPGQAQVWMWVE